MLTNRRYWLGKPEIKLHVVVFPALKNPKQEDLVFESNLSCEICLKRKIWNRKIKQELRLLSSIKYCFFIFHFFSPKPNINTTSKAHLEPPLPCPLPPYLITTEPKAT